MAAGALAATRWDTTFEQAGVRARLELESAAGGALRAGERALLRVTLTRDGDGSPLPRLFPAVWFNTADASEAESEAACARRVARYARGSIANPQSLMAITGYDVLALTAGPSIAVLDPRTRFAGRTSLRATIELPGPGFDWAADAEDRWLWVTVPSKRALARVDLAALRLAAVVPLPGTPARVRVEPGTGRAWVGITDSAQGAGGVAVVEAAPPHRVHWIPLEASGFVDLAFDPAGWVAATQRASPTVTFIDPESLRAAHRERLAVRGATPVSVIFDGVARRFLVAEARGGSLFALDARGRTVGSIALAPGIGPLATSPDGRWLLALNPAAHGVHVVDLARWAKWHELPVSGRPFDVVVTPAFAHVRALDSEALTLIDLASLATAPRVLNVAIGERPPANAPHLPLASGMAPMADGAGSFVVSPADQAIYSYMEGMNAAIGATSVRGHAVRAVRLARQGLRETAPGIYSIEVELPRVQRLHVALATDAPRTRLCASLALAPPTTDQPVARELEWDALPVSDVETVLAVRLAGVSPERLPAALRIRLFQPGATERWVTALHMGEGRYRAALHDLPAGLWYAHALPPAGITEPWPYVSFLRTATP